MWGEEEEGEEREHDRKERMNSVRESCKFCQQNRGGKRGEKGRKRENESQTTSRSSLSEQRHKKRARERKFCLTVCETLSAWILLDLYITCRLSMNKLYPSLTTELLLTTTWTVCGGNCRSQRECIEWERKWGKEIEKEYFQEMRKVYGRLASSSSDHQLQ